MMKILFKNIFICLLFTISIHGFCQNKNNKAISVYDSVYYRVLLGYYFNTHPPDSVITYINNNFKNYTCYITRTKTNNLGFGYKVEIGDFRCYKDANTVYQKVYKDGFKDHAVTLIRSHRCWIDVMIEEAKKITEGRCK